MSALFTPQQAVTDRTVSTPEDITTIAAARHGTLAELASLLCLPFADAPEVLVRADENVAAGNADRGVHALSAEAVRGQVVVFRPNGENERGARSVSDVDG